MKQIEIYTDGACSGNPGPGGWGAILRFRTAQKVYEKELSGGEAYWRVRHFPAGLYSGDSGAGHGADRRSYRCRNSCYFYA